MPRDEATPTLRVLGPRDRAAAIDVAIRSFPGNPFYESAMGLRGQGFRAYWEEFLQLALASPDARVYGIEHRDRLHGLIVAAFDGFPSGRPALLFVAALARRVGPWRCLRYLRFVRAYDRAMHRIERSPSREARCLWLMVAPGAERRLGPALVRETRAALWHEGKIKGTGFINAGDSRIVAFYRRLGFTVSGAFPFGGGWAATIEIPTSPGGTTPPC